MNKKISHSLACLFVFVGALSPVLVQADSKQDAEMAALFAKAFGNKSTQKTNRSALHSQSIQMAPHQQVAKGNRKRNLKSNQTTDINALFAKAFGKKNVALVPPQVTVDLKINKTKLGDVKIFSNRRGVMESVETANFLSLLKDVVKEHVYNRVAKKISAHKKTPFRTLSQLGIKVNYDSTDLSLGLHIKPELRKPLVLSMGSKRQTSVRDENKISAEEISAFLNLYGNATHASGSGNKPQLNVKLEGSLNIGNAVLETTVDYRKQKFKHAKTTLTYDKPNKLQRFVVGNISTGNRNFQENLNLKGIRLSKEFFMNPELQIRPRANESFVLDSDSEVEVYINKLLRQRFYLRAGIYSLEDIGLYDGANNIEVRIKDEFGKVTVKTSQQYYDSHLLKKGLSFYAISVGRLSNEKTGVNNALINQSILSGYYQKGINKDLTLSLDAQISPDSYLLGAEAITSIELGSIKTSMAISGGRYKDSGVAARFEFKPNRRQEKIGLDTLRQDMLGLETTIGGSLKNWTLSGELRSEGFSVLNGVQAVDGFSHKSNRKLKARLQTNFNFDFSDDWRGSLNVGVSDYYDTNESLSANLTATRQFNNGTSLSLGARYDSDDDFSVNLQISIPLFKESGGRKKRFDMLANSKDSSLETKLSIRPESLVGNNSFAGSIEHIQNDTSRQQNLDLAYRQTNFETKLNARNRFSKKNHENYQQLSLGFNTSIACVGNNCATSYPIDDSFALVSGPSNQQNPIALNNNNRRFKYSDDNDTGLPDNYTALINKNSKAVVRLASYRFQNINIDESTLPDGYDTEKTEFEVFPRYHQGFLIKAGGEPATILDGALVDETGKALAYKGGQWVPKNNKKGKAIAFFSNKVGRFRISSIPAGAYQLELFDYPDMRTIHIAVPSLKGKVHKLGDLRIVE